MRFRLCQLQVVHRHGDRTPLWNVFAGCSVREWEEKERWDEKLPDRDLKQALRADRVIGCSAELRRSSTPQLEALDTTFGKLTTLGAYQMMELGKSLKSGLVQRGYHDFLGDKCSVKRIMVFANSHERTQESACALTHGLLEERSKEWVRMELLQRPHDFINGYAAYPHLTRMKAEMDKTCPKLTAKEQELYDLKKHISDVLPIFSSGNKEFIWMLLADYYTCRECHDIALIPGTEAYRETALQHLAFRFEHFYCNKPILKLVAGNLLRRIEHYIEQATAGMETEHLVIYSGHDVTLLSLLHVLKADVVKGQHFWPAYSAAVTIELLREDVGDYFVHIRLHGTTLRLQDGTEAMFTVEYFRSLIASNLYY